jgi:hypothetical protein
LTLDDSSILNSLLKEFEHADELVKDCESGDIKGYITTQPPKETTSKDPIYEDFMPFKPTHLPPTTTFLEYDSVSLLNLLVR